MVGRSVLLGVGPVLEIQVVVHCPLTIYPRVLGPNFSKRLANGVDDVLHYVGAKFLTAGADVSMAVLGGKCGNDWDRFLLWK